MQRSTPWSIYSYPGAQMHHHHITALMIVVYAFSSRWLSTTIMHCSQEHSGLFSPWCSAAPASSDSAGELAPGQHADQLGHLALACGRVAEVAREHGWHPPKSLDSDENFKPEHTLFCLELRFVAIYALFGDLWAKKVPFWVKNSVSWARSALLHGIYCIF